jgi:hypothetical protein
MIQASVRHDELAEVLSESVARLFTRVSRCTAHGEVFDTSNTKQQLIDLYRYLFTFLGDAANWYMKTRTERFLDSFNSELMPNHQKTIDKIDHACQMFNETVARYNSVIALDNNRMLREITGHQMNDLLMQQAQSLARASMARMNQCWFPAQLLRQKNHPADRITDHLQNQEVLMPRMIEESGTRTSSIRSDVRNDVGRDDAAKRLQRLSAFVCGTNGTALARYSFMKLADEAVIRRISQWMKNTQSSERLWITFPWVPGQATSSRMAALGVIGIAMAVDAPFVSYICQQPDEDAIDESLSPQRAGLLSLVYSLIQQLLKFQPQDDGFHVDQEFLDRLDGVESSWKSALTLLRSLLKYTSILRYVIIDGINRLEGGDATADCMELLELLFECSGDPSFPTSFLFTTAGRSEVLFEVMGFEERAVTDKHMRAVQRKGEVLQQDSPTWRRMG